MSTVRTLSSTSEAWLDAEETAITFATPEWLTTRSMFSRSLAAAAEPVDDNPEAALSLLGLPHTAQMARCDLRTGGRFALCRI